jgi:YD repeat-containing protein
LDQVTSVKQYAGGTGGTYQETTIEYDGHGRLWTRKLPSQDYATTYAYNYDDTVYSVTDARGSTATYSYNNRHLVINISYSAPSGVTAAAAVSFSYDSAGNRTQMTDGLGSASYVYNTLAHVKNRCLM